MRLVKLVSSYPELAALSVAENSKSGRVSYFVRSRLLCLVSNSRNAFQRKRRRVYVGSMSMENSDPRRSVGIGSTVVRATPFGSGAAGGIEANSRAMTPPAGNARWSTRLLVAAGLAVDLPTANVGSTRRGETCTCATCRTTGGFSSRTVRLVVRSQMVGPPGVLMASESPSSSRTPPR